MPPTLTPPWSARTPVPGGVPMTLLIISVIVIGAISIWLVARR
jgi:hypothetical protein